MVICLEQGADLHVAQLMPLPLTRVVLDKGPLNGCVLSGNVGDVGGVEIRQFNRLAVRSSVWTRLHVSDNLLIIFFLGN